MPSRRLGPQVGPRRGPPILREQEFVLPDIRVPSPLTTNTAEGGTNGTTVTSLNSGGVSGIAWDSVSIGAGSTLTFDNTHASHGALGYKFDAVTANGYVEWSEATGTEQEWYSRFYIYTPSPASTIHFFNVLDGTAQTVRLRLETNRTLSISDAAVTVIGTTTNAVNLNSWTRVEMHVIHSATVGFVELKFYNTPESVTPTETLTLSNQNLGVRCTKYRLGFATAPTVDANPFWLDSISILGGVGDYLGPFLLTVNPPLIGPTSTLFAPSVVPSAAPPLIGPTGTLYAPSVRLTVTNNAEGGTNGTTVTTGNSGGTSGAAWDTVAIGASTLTYETAHAAHGSLSYALNPATSVSTYLLWNTAFGTQTEFWGRMYLYITGFDATLAQRLHQFSDGATTGGGFKLQPSTGVLRILAGPSLSSVGTDFANAPATNQWVRLEWHVICNATTGSIELKLFNTADSATPTETQTVTSQNTGAQATEYRFGQTNSIATDIAKFWLDDIGASNVAYLGPVGAAAITVQPGVIGPTSVLYAPKVAVTEKPGLIGPTSTTFAPTKVVLTVKPAAIGPTGTLFAPLAKTVRVYAPKIGPTGILYAPREVLKPAPGVIGPTSTLFAPTRVYTARVFPPVRSSATTLYAPTTRVTEKPGLIGPTSVLYSPTKVLARVAPPLLGPTGVLYGPTIRVTEKPGLIGPTNVRYAPSVSTRVKPPLISQAQLFAPTTRVTEKPGKIGPTGLLYAPTAKVTVTPPKIGPTSTPFAPTKVATVRVYAPTLAQLGTPVAPTIRLTVKAPLIGPTSQTFAPARAYTSRVYVGLIGPTGVALSPASMVAEKPGKIGPTGVLYSPTTSFRVRAPVISLTVTYPPAVRVTERPGRIGPTALLFAPSVAAGGISPPLIGPTGVVYAPTVGTSRVYAPLRASSTTLYAPAARVSAAPGVIGPTGLLYAPAASLRVLVPLLGPTGALYPPATVRVERPGRIGPTGTLFAPTVAVGAILAPRIGPTSVAFAPAKIVVRLLPVGIGPTGVVYAPRLVRAASPPRIGPTSTLYAPEVRVVRVYQPTIGPTGVLFPPSVVAPTFFTGLRVAIDGSDTSTLLEVGASGNPAGDGVDGARVTESGRDGSSVALVGAE